MPHELGDHLAQNILVDSGALEVKAKYWSHHAMFTPALAQALAGGWWPKLEIYIHRVMAGEGGREDLGPRGRSRLGPQNTYRSSSCQSLFCDQIYGHSVIPQS